MLLTWPGQLHNKWFVVKSFEARILNLGREGKTFDSSLTQHLHATRIQAKILKSWDFSSTQNYGMLPRHMINEWSNYFGGPKKHVFA